MIVCKLLPLPSIGTSVEIEENSRSQRYGRYHGSCFWDVKDFGSKKWVVAAYIKPEDDDCLDQESIEEITRKCIEFLNQPPPRKKYAKRQPKPKYGKLEYYNSKLIERRGEKCISVLFVVDDRKSKLFWGKGKTVV